MTTATSLPPTASADAALHGHVEALSFALEHGCPVNNNTILYAALHGHTEVLQWLHTNGHELPPDTASCAASSGQLQELQWLLSIGFSWAALHCEETAAVHGHPHEGVLLWAIENGPDSVHHSICTTAAASDWLEFLQWLRECGCKWDRNQCLTAAAESAALGLGNETELWLREQED